MTKKLKRNQPKKTESIDVPLSVEEKKQIVEMAQREALPLATFVRWKILRKEK